MQKINSSRKNKIFILFLCALAVLVWIKTLSREEPLLKVTFLDIGQGDACLIEFPGGGNMLIDGGEGGKYNKGKSIVSYLRRRGINRIDILLLTHPHDDHVGGLLSILKSFSVSLVLDGGKIHTSYTYEKFLKLIETKKIPYRIIKSGDKIDGIPKIKILILHPSPLPLEETGLDMNNNSVVLKITYGEIGLLFTGDIEKEAEAELLRYGPLLQNTLIKVPHHGSLTSSSSVFLDAVNPQIAVISVGKNNPFRHPSPKIINRYRKKDIKVYRTDTQGAITFSTDGKSFWISTMR